MAAEQLVTTIVFRTDYIRGCLERANQAKDLDEVRGILSEADQYVDQLLSSAKAEQAEIDAQRP